MATLLKRPERLATQRPASAHHARLPSYARIAKQNLPRIGNGGGGGPPKAEARYPVPLRWLLPIVVVICIWRALLGGSTGEAAAPATASPSKPTKNLFVPEWMQHMLSHPVQASDRLCFAEMALRTRVYTRLLEAKSTALVDSFETNLWPFVLASKSLREAHFGSEPAPLLEAETDLAAIQMAPASPRRRIESKSDNFVPTPPATHHSRGIVMSLGRSELRYAMHFLNILRNVHKSKLPVELYYYGEDDLPLFMRKHLESSYENVKAIDLEALSVFDPLHARLSRQGWALKPFALLATNLTEVILTDADVVFLAKPDDFFDVAGYKDTGTLFFHDRDHFRQGASEIIHTFLNEQLGALGPSERLAKSKFWQRRGIYEQESGVVVVNKGIREVFSALFFAAWQNTGSVRERTTYRVFWGDKESYWLAFELARFPYYFVDLYAGGLGNDPYQGRFCSDHPLHFLPDPTAKKVNGKHVGRAAWFNGSLMENKGKGDNVYLNQTQWATGMEWDFLEDTERWCVSNSTYSGQSIAEILPSSLALDTFISAALAADDAHEQLNLSLQ